jgi:hypothetical protein
MRPWIFTALLGLSAAAGLSGCGGSAPYDPYSNLQMAAPEQAGGARTEEDPVLEAERAYNAKFTPKDKRARK